MRFYLTTILLIFFYQLNSQSVDFQEFDLDNGLHVILHKDNSAPVVVTSVMYHIGAKDEDPDKTGFAHFFEHLLFEGTKNIERGQWDIIVNSNGGRYNANTSPDRTYYYEVFPSNKLEIALWLESERMLHPKVSQLGIDTQNEVVKEEKRLSENQPYGKLREVISENLFKVHPYKGTVIGKMEHLDSATEEDYKSFNKKYHIPNNAVLVVAGDIEIDKNRFEQEMIYYLEKLDINEEKVRLKLHISHFKKSMKEGDGKKLGFISQEIGREINTLGSKSSHAEMQKIVIEMKEGLEKMKEQLLNIL